MEEQKWWLNSQTVQGTFLTIIPTFVGFLHLFGFSVAAGEAETIVNGLAGLSGAVGAVMAILGRFKANTKISVSKPEV